MIDLTLAFKDFVIAAAGAVGGAYGAQIITEQTKSKDDLVKEIRNTNAAIALTFSICNSLLSLKNQHTKRMKETYDIQRATCLSQISLQQRGVSVPTSRFDADLQQLSLPYQPIAVLQTQLFEKLSVRGRALNLITTLAQILETLHQFLEKRNELIKHYQTQNFSSDEFNILFFGLPYNGGHVNNEYPSCIDSIYTSTDDGAFCAQLLCKDLVKHGRRLAQRYKIKFGKDAPQIDKPDFSKAEKNGLMPKPDNYSDWFAAFVVRPRPPKSRWGRVRNKWYFWRKKGLA